MRRAVVLLWIGCVAAMAAKVDFRKEKAGAVPRDWVVAMTSQGGAPRWEVVEDAAAPTPPRVLGQLSADETSGRFPLAIYEKAKLADGRVSVKFKTVSGVKDQAAGVVWRYQDPGNYYIVRANALEDNVVLYKVEGGKRVALAPVGTPEKTYGVKHKVPKGVWSSLRVEFVGKRFVVYFDGEKVMEVEDGTFAGAGKTGLWTKADSVTYFDDFEVGKK
ncbi:MAG: DUF1080 domain-containing protein [Acidobacteria bacterium]|nr:DUF1080 domain-containing protein [Acidobacteriota bacterium]